MFLSKTEVSDHLAKRWLIAIFLLAVALRIGAALYMGDSVYDLPGLYDQLSYDGLAQRVVAGHGFSFGTDWWPATRAGEPTAHWSYAMTLYLAAVYKVFGYHPLVARLIQAVVAGVLMPLLTYRLAMKVTANPSLRAESGLLSETEWSRRIAGRSEAIPVSSAASDEIASSQSALLAMTGSQKALPDEIASSQSALLAMTGGRGVALLAAAISAVYIYFFYYAAALMTETFYFLCILASLNLAISIAQDASAQGAGLSLTARWAKWIALGLTMGLAVLFRQTFMLFVPFLLGWIWWAGRDIKDEGGRMKAEGGRRKDEGGRMKDEGGRRKDEGGRRKDEDAAELLTEGGRMKDEGGRRKDEGGRMKAEGPKRAASSFILHPSSFRFHPSSFRFHPSSFILHPSSLIPVAVIALMILPWTIRNYRAFDQFVLLNTNAGYVMFWANHPMHGTSFRQPQGAETPDYHGVIPAELLALDEASLEKALMARGVQFVLDDPGRYVLLTLSRIPDHFVFWPKAESSTISNISRVGSFGVFLPFMVYGLALSLAYMWRRRRHLREDGPGAALALLCLFFFVYSAIHVLTWPGIRYRLPTDTVLVVFAAIGIADLYERVKRGTGEQGKRGTGEEVTG